MTGEILSSKFIQMDLYGDVAYRLQKRSKTMCLNVGVKKDFEQYVPKRHIWSVGVADTYRNQAYLFIDEIIFSGNIDQHDVWGHCFNCSHPIIKKQGRTSTFLECSIVKNIDDLWIIECIREINITAVHELVHLCDNIQNDQLWRMDENLYPYEGCLHFKESEV